MARMAQEQSGGKEPGEIVKVEGKPKETKLAKVQPQVSLNFIIPSKFLMIFLSNILSGLPRHNKYKLCTLIRFIHFNLGIGNTKTSLSSCIEWCTKRPICKQSCTKYQWCASCQYDCISIAKSRTPSNISLDHKW